MSRKQVENRIFSELENYRESIRQSLHQEEIEPWERKKFTTYFKELKKSNFSQKEQSSLCEQ